MNDTSRGAGSADPQADQNIALRTINLLDLAKTQSREAVHMLDVAFSPTHIVTARSHLMQAAKQLDELVMMGGESLPELVGKESAA